MPELNNFSIVVAATKDMGIGTNGALPWNLKQDMRYFKKLTTTYYNNSKNVCIMGRLTYESIPEKFRPLSGRINIIVSRTMQSSDARDTVVCRSFEKALEWSTKYFPKSKIFCIGGAQIYNEALDHPNLECIYFTLVTPKKSLELTTFINPIPDKFKLLEVMHQDDIVINEGDFVYEFQIYKIA